MAIVDNGRPQSYFGRRRSERREAAFIFAILYPPCLAAALLKRLGIHAGRAQSHSCSRSVFAEARAMAASVIPFIFR